MSGLAVVDKRGGVSGELIERPSRRPCRELATPIDEGRYVCGSAFLFFVFSFAGKICKGVQKVQSGGNFEAGR